jgi:radical SAM superfamily enzyme YgiQ (UPF0313 family)
MRILFSTPYIPYKKAKPFEDNIDFFYYRNTLKQGIFQLRQMQSWHPLHFIAQNLPVYSVILENPTLKQFKSEIEKNNYDAIALSFTIVTTDRILKMVSWVKELFPKIDIIIGGYGTAIFSENYGIEQEIRKRVDHICNGEGLYFMRKYVSEKCNIETDQPLKQDLLPINISFFRSRLIIHQSLNFVASLGCNYRCSFCSTSNQFKSKIDLFSGFELYKSIKDSTSKYKNAQSGVIFNEDFLADRNSVLEFMRFMEKDEELIQRPFFLTVFSSVKSISLYTLSELIRCGIGMIFIGVESFNHETLTVEKLNKRGKDSIQIETLFRDLNSAGIHTLGSIIIGWDNQTTEMAQEELHRFVKLNPTMYQVMPLQAIPGTPLWQKMRGQNRIVPDFNYETVSLEKASFNFKNFSQEESVEMIYRTYKNLVDYGGPWPFRMYTNFRRGINTMKYLDGIEFKNRLIGYRKMILPLFVLSFISGFLFFGKNFREKWAQEMKVSFQEYPLLFLAVALISLITTPILLLTVFAGCMRHLILPYGDQPESIRREYSNQL